MGAQFTHIVGHCSLCVICCCVPRLLVEVVVVGVSCPSLSLSVDPVCVSDDCFPQCVCNGWFRLLFQVHSI